MSIITAYKSEIDGKLFEEKSAYQRHLRKLTADKRTQLAEVRKLQQSNQWWHDNLYNKVRSIEQLKAAILLHAEEFGLNGLKHTYSPDRDKSPVPIIVGFTHFNVAWSPEVSNSHSCPVNGVTNWGGNVDGAPRGYPGLSGRIEYSVKWVKKFDGYYPGGSDMWANTRLHTGTGGGGGFKLYPNDKVNGAQSFGYEFRLYLSDWPGLEKSYQEAEEQVVWLTLQHGINNFQFDYDLWVNETYPAEDYE